jgi:long-chain acyl-CoA synthetase
VSIDFLLEVFRGHPDDEAIVHHDRILTYGRLADSVGATASDLARSGVGPGAVASLEADFAPQSIAALLALLAAGAISIPIGPASASRAKELRALAQAEHRVVVEPGGVAIEATGTLADHPLYSRLREVRHPGLVLFTSGTTGEPKAALHDGVRLLGKYRTPRHRLRTLMFLLFDHIGGIDTMLHALSNASTLVIPDDRTPEGICRTIARHRVEVLPASPSFLTLLLLSEAHRRHDLSSLRYVTYGAEVMPQSTLARLAREFPHVTLLQKYGLTELGTLRSHSRANDSLWVRVGGEGFRTRVVDGMLEVQADSSMLGYLNAPSPFTPDGWFMTGDAVEVDGEYLRILGRASDLINVAGRKVYPGEVESVVQEVENVAEVAVYGERHPFTGQIVAARVTLRQPEDPRTVERRIRDHCRVSLEDYKVPAKIQIVGEPLHSVRQKITRR